MCFLMSACQTRPVLADATESYTIRFPIEVKEERFQEDFPVRFFTYIVGYAPHVFVTRDSNVSSGPSCRCFSWPCNILWFRSHSVGLELAWRLRCPRRPGARLQGPVLVLPSLRWQRACLMNLMSYHLRQDVLP